MLVPDRSKMRRRQDQDDQIRKCPGQVLILAEANQATQEVLEKPAVAASDPFKCGLAGRPTREHLVVRGNEEYSILIAARKDNCSRLAALEHNVNEYGSPSKRNILYAFISTCKGVRP